MAFSSVSDVGGRTAGDGSIQVVVNGEVMVLPAATKASDLLEELGLARKPVAVEINREVVPRRYLGERTLSAGDQLEIVTLVGGG